MRKGIFLTALAVTLLVASASVQAGETLLSSFENTLGTGWTTSCNGTSVDFDGYEFIAKTDSTYGWAVTEGDYALALDFKTGWKQGLCNQYGFTGLFPGFAGASELWLDASSNQALSGYYGQGGNWQLSIFIQGEAGDANGMFPIAEYLQTGVKNYGGGNVGLEVPGTYINLDPVYSYDNATMTVKFDLTNGGAYTAAGGGEMAAYDPLYGGWFDLRIHTNIGTVWGEPGYVIIDNVRAVTGGTGAGDFNDDGEVDIADYTAWADRFGQDDAILPDGSVPMPNGNIGIEEYTTWADNFGNDYDGAGVPEPATMALLGLGALGLIRRRR